MDAGQFAQALTIHDIDLGGAEEEVFKLFGKERIDLEDLKEVLE